MLVLIVTALLSASAHLLGAAGAPVVPAPPDVVTVAPAASPATTVVATVAVPTVAGGRVPDAPSADEEDAAPAVPTAGDRPGPAAACGEADEHGPSASDCLAALGSAEPACVTAWAAGLDDVGDDSSALVSRLVPELDPAGTSAWWSALPPERRRLLADELPGVVGNLEGLPYEIRDEANRAHLARSTMALAQRSGTRSAADDDPARLAMLQQVLLAVQDRTAGSEDRELVALDTVLPGRAAVVVGDLDLADDVTVLVPGMFFTVTGQLVDWSETAGQLHDEQSRWASRLAGDDGPDRAAVVAWMGYRTPDLSNIYDLGLARTGAAHLEDALTGLDAARAAAPARVTVVAHSYGSTTAMVALSTHRVTVDSLVVLGSPGSVVTRADELAVRGGDVYAAAGSFDPVAGSAFYGPDPGSGAFGAVLLHTGGAVDPLTSTRLGAALGHNSYLSPGTETARDVALVGLGRGDLVEGDERVPGEPRPGAPGLGLVRPQDLWPRD